MKGVTHGNRNFKIVIFQLKLTELNSVPRAEFNMLCPWGAKLDNFKSLTF